jgi:hypothetical protein
MRHVEVSAMYEMLRLAISALVVCFVSFPTNASAQAPERQMQLTEKNVEGFIAAQKEMAALAEKNPRRGIYEP